VIAVAQIAGQTSSGRRVAGEAIGAVARRGARRLARRVAARVGGARLSFDEEADAVAVALRLDALDPERAEDGAAHDVGAEEGGAGVDRDAVALRLAARVATGWNRAGAS
jgi:hypothetical protein